MYVYCIVCFIWRVIPFTKNFVSTCNQATIVVLLLTSRNGNYSTVTAKEATELKWMNE